MNNKRVFFVTFFLLSFILFFTSLAQEKGKNLLFILDASGSMWQKAGGEYKIVAARKVMKGLLEDLPSSTKVGLIAYGHRRKSDCADIETIVPITNLDKVSISEKIDGLDPKGETPIASAVKLAFETTSLEDETTIIVISDGIETCGGDPCTNVNEAKKMGKKFVMHVIGLDLEKEDVSQLECAAQAGGGLYLSANNANELANALKQTAKTQEIPPGRISVKALLNGELEDVGVRVFKAGTKESVAFGRTYRSPQTNPRILPVPQGNYDIVIEAIALKGKNEQRFENVEVTADKVVEKIVDFTQGELSIKTTRNGELSDATITVYNAGTKEHVSSSRTYRSSTTNPKIFKITPGAYDILIGAIEISSKPEHLFENVIVKGAKKVERSFDFASSTLKIGAVNAAELVDVVVRVINAESNKNIASGRTYTSTGSNPSTFIVPPGKYRITLGAVKLEGRPKREISVVVQAKETVEKIIDFKK